jgi:predicted RNA methylase
LAGRVVIDFGRGESAEAIEVAQRWARRVTGIDIRPNVLDVTGSGPGNAMCS